MTPLLPRVVLIPGVMALLPSYAGIEDPVADLRAACLAAVGSLSGRVEVLATGAGAKVAIHLLNSTSRIGDDPTWLVVANGSAKRSEKAPGHLDHRARAFDDTLHTLLTTPDPAGLIALDTALAHDLWADVESLVGLGREVLTPHHHAVVDYDDDPYGVRYWVIRWAPGCDAGGGSAY
jgi:hypothetical protein